MNDWLLEERGILGKCLPLTVHRFFGDMNMMYWTTMYTDWHCKKEISVIRVSEL
jgi:hypothetical protein